MILTIALGIVLAVCIIQAIILILPAIVDLGSNLVDMWEGLDKNVKDLLTIIFNIIFLVVCLVVYLKIRR